MAPSTTNGRRIAARARTLRERLRSPPGDSEILDCDGDEWISRWREHIGDDSATFERRLELEDLSAEECRQRLHSRTLPDEELPEWVERLDELLEYVETREPADPPNLVETADDVPFVHLLARFVAFASERLDWEDSPDCLTENARLDLERWLLDRLSSVASHTLFIEFKTFVASHDRELALADDPEVPDSPRRYYDQFVADMHEGELRSLFEEYSTLARMVVTLTDQWRGAVESFRARLRADREALAETFSSGESLGSIVALDYHGDPHQGGRVVFHLTFESGVELAYKPRDVRPEARFAGLVSWINTESDCVNLDALDCLAREGYGWMAWADSKPCPTEESVGQYYRRAGSLLCLLYALNFTDGHLENVVASGEYPVVVDLETLMHPDLPRSAMPPASELPEPRQNSLLRTDMLPEDAPDSDVQSAAGFDAASGEQTGVQIPSFERVNTDVMELEYESTVTFSGDSLPKFEESRIEPHEHSDRLAEGFAETYQFLLDHRDAFLADDGPVGAFSDAEIRFVYRPSQTYQSVLTPLTTPKYLRTGRALGAKMERLARPFATDGTDQQLWPAYEAERTALWRSDVPRFSVRADDTTLLHDGTPVADVFDASPLEQVRRRIEEFSESDLAEQLDLLDLAYGSGTPASPSDDHGQVSDSEQIGDSEQVTKDISADVNLRQEARNIFDRIRKTFARASESEGTPTWYHYESGQGGVQLSPVGDDFYRGRLGIAVFCGALAATTDEEVDHSKKVDYSTETDHSKQTDHSEETYRDFAMRIGSPVVNELDDGLLSDREVGAGTGIGSFVYGFAVLGDLLDADEFTDAARRSASLLTPERFKADTHNDVMSGNAGAVLSLLALHDRTGDDELLEKAIAAGEQLLADRVVVDDTQVWRVTDGQVAMGMAHGIAGIAYALARLSDATGEERFRDAALEALRYENSAYSAEQQNWHHSNSDSNFNSSVESETTSWCWGRSGIGLSRLGMYEMRPDEAIFEDVERALAGTDSEVLEDFDHLCCGNFARVDLLLQAGRLLDEPTYREAARELATATIRRADERGQMDQFVVPKQTNQWFNPSFFKGETGIGYTLLGLDEPELPCVTLWE